MSALDGLAAIVTGGASGLGAAIADRFLSDGARVAVLDLDISSVPRGAFGFRTDVTDDASVQAAVAQAADRLGGIDVVVNTAGIGARGDVAGNSDDEWHRVFDVNVVGIARVTRAALPHLRASGNAAVINVASVVATIGMPDRALYSATKGAVVSLTRAMAADHLEDGIRVNCVCPGTADTPWIERLLVTSAHPAREREDLESRQPHGRLVRPDEVADAVAYLADPRSGSANGLVLAVDGGLGAIKVPSRSGT